MADDGIEQFVRVTGASKEDATFYLDSAGGNVETAIDSFFSTGGGAADGLDEEGASIDEGNPDASLASVPSTGASQAAACMLCLQSCLECTEGAQCSDDGSMSLIVYRSDPFGTLPADSPESSAQSLLSDFT